jgi:hypothetical protein
MKIHSEQIEDKLTVTLNEVADTQSVIDTVEACKDGQCACSTDEFQKVQNIEILPGRDSIILNVDVKKGEIIDPQCISDCLQP